MHASTLNSQAANRDQSLLLWPLPRLLHIICQGERFWRRKRKGKRWLWWTQQFEQERATHVVYTYIQCSPCPPLTSRGLARTKY